MCKRRSSRVFFSDQYLLKSFNYFEEFTSRRVIHGTLGRVVYSVYTILYILCYIMLYMCLRVRARQIDTREAGRRIGRMYKDER